MALTKITSNLVAVNAIQGTLIADNAITAVHIVNNAVTATQLADNAVTATKIQNGIIATDHLAADLITAAKIADDAISEEHLDVTVISSLTSVTANSSDYVMVGDASDSNNLKKALVSDFGNTSEQIQDIAGAMFSSNTETGITATYQDGDGTVDLVVGTLNQNTTGTADLITATANNSTNETVYPTFVDGATGSQGIETDTGLTYNPSTGMLTSTGLTGTLTGNVTGNITGNTSGTAATVTTAAQGAITSTGTLTALTVSGNTQSASLTVGTSSAEGEALYIVDGGHTGHGASNTVSLASFAESVSGNSAGPWLGCMTNENTAVIGTRTASGNLAFQTYSSGWGERMRLTSAGNLGIGTTSPAELLHIYKDNSDVNPQLKIEQDGTGDAGLVFLLSGVRNWSMGIDNSDSDKFKIAPQGDVADTTALTIDTSGNVGINEATPVKKLVIAGSSGAGATVMIHMDADTAGGTGALVFKNDSTNTDVRQKGAVIFRRDDPGTRGTGSLGLCVNGVNSDTNVSWSDAKFTIGANGMTAINDTPTTNYQLWVTGSVIPLLVKATSGNSDHEAIIINRSATDGVMIAFQQGGSEKGTIAQSGSTVSYNAFMGSHYSESTEDLSSTLLGTVMETVNTLVTEKYEDQKRLPKCKVSSTSESPNVYGVWIENNNTGQVAALGASWCRINKDVTVSRGDLLVSNGDGTAKIQSDDIIRSKTIGKVISTIKKEIYDDGSYAVPVVLHCG
jgi:hypothetical protein